MYDRVPRRQDATDGPSRVASGAPLESHFNSLGIAAFLAPTKLFNKVTNFLVLDDIVTSFD